jgi:flagellar biosynthesis chaperone FliJ
LCLRLLEERREEIQTNCKRLENGVNKLFNANHLVAQLKVDLTKLQPELDLQNKNVNEALILLERDSGKAREQEIIVEREKEEINHKVRISD